MHCWRQPLTHEFNENTFGFANSLLVCTHIRIAKIHVCVNLKCVKDNRHSCCGESPIPESLKYHKIPYYIFSFSHNLQQYIIDDILYVNLSLLSLHN